jgi:hypothetical protein
LGDFFTHSSGHPATYSHSAKAFRKWDNFGKVVPSKMRSISDGLTTFGQISALRFNADFRNVEVIMTTPIAKIMT